MKCLHVFIIAIFLLATFSCSKYKNIEYHFSNLKVNNLDNSGAETTVSAADSLNSKAYGIRLNLYPIIDKETSESFSAEKSQVINTNTITSIYITSSDSFDVNLPPGACLNKRFIYYKNVYNTFDTIGCQTGIMPSLYYSPNYKEKRVPDYADILLIHPPKNIKTHRFKIRLTLTDGTQFTDSTSAIKLY